MEPATTLTTYPGACDCHVHIYEDRYPLVPGVAWVPRHSPVSLYRKAQQAVGLQRAVVVQPTGYGYDNDCLLAAIAELGDDARGIALLAPDAPAGEIQRLHAGGVRGVRYMMIGGVLTWDSLEPMAARMADVGWMVNLQLDGRGFPAHEEVLKRLPCPLVLDHNGKFLEPVEPGHPAFQSLLRILDTGNVWIKLSAPYETSKVGAPAYDPIPVAIRCLPSRRCTTCFSIGCPKTRCAARFSSATRQRSMAFENSAASAPSRAARRIR
jgi:D-galactarolactone isomerase